MRGLRIKLSLILAPTLVSVANAATLLKCRIQKKIVTTEFFHGNASEEEIIIAPGKIKEGSFVLEKKSLKDLAWTFSPVPMTPEKQLYLLDMAMRHLKTMEYDSDIRVTYQIENRDTKGASVRLRSFAPQFCFGPIRDCHKESLVRINKRGEINNTLEKKELVSSYESPWGDLEAKEGYIGFDLGLKVSCDFVVRD